jgi:CcmD family protein
MIKFLYAAYAVTWIVHLCYLGWLTLGYRKLRDEIEDLKK